MSFTFRPRVIKEQIKATGVLPVDVDPPVNFPTVLLNTGQWVINAVSGNIWKATNLDDITLISGSDVGIEGPWRFNHRILDVQFSQFDGAGAVNDDPLTYSWDRAVRGGFFPVRAAPGAATFDDRYEGVRFDSDIGGETYRFIFDGTTDNTIVVEVWFEVLRV